MKVPLRTILRDFLFQFEKLEENKLSYDPYGVEFQELKKVTDKLKDDPIYSSACALKDVNIPKNRYKDIVPYDSSRVVLPKCEGIPGSDYINASYIKGASGAIAYIAAQGPLPNTVIDFWRMIWFCDTQVIVMACNEKEKEKVKCECYWPPKGEMKHYGNISVETVEISQICPDFLVRTLLVKCDTEFRDVYQFHYTSWPDHSVPDTVYPILELVRLMRECQSSETVPIVIHCSAGCGRTGTICAIDYVRTCLKQGKINKDFSLLDVALGLRCQRIAMIQAKEQFMTIYKAVAVMFQQHLNIIDCHIYENVDEDGEPLEWKVILLDNNNCLSCSVESNSAAVSCMEQNKDASEINSPSVNSEISASSNSDRDVKTSSNEDHIPFIDEEECSIEALNEQTTASNCNIAVETNDENSNNKSSVDEGMRHSNFYAYDDGNLNSLKIPFPVTVQKNESSLILEEITKKDSMSNFKKSEELHSLDNHEQEIDTSGCSNYHLIEHKHCDNDLANPQSSDISVTLKKFKNLVLGNQCKKVATWYDVTKNSKDEVQLKQGAIFRPRKFLKLQSLSENSPKNTLFRNSTCISRAASAPSSLNCFSKITSDQKDSIVVTRSRKFRSSSVKSSHDINTQGENALKNKTSCVNKKFNSVPQMALYNFSKMKTDFPVLNNPSSSIEQVFNNNGMKSHFINSEPNEIAICNDKTSLPHAIIPSKLEEAKKCTANSNDNKNASVACAPTKSLFIGSNKIPPNTSSKWYDCVDANAVFSQGSVISSVKSEKSDSISRVDCNVNMHLLHSVEVRQKDSQLPSKCFESPTAHRFTADKEQQNDKCRSTFYINYENKPNVNKIYPQKNLPKHGVPPVPKKIATEENSTVKSTFWPVDHRLLKISELSSNTSESNNCEHKVDKNSNEHSVLHGTGKINEESDKLYKVLSLEPEELNGKMTERSKFDKIAPSRELDTKVKEKHELYNTPPLLPNELGNKMKEKIESFNFCTEKKVIQEVSSDIPSRREQKTVLESRSLECKSIGTPKNIFMSAVNSAVCVNEKKSNIVKALGINCSSPTDKISHQTYSMENELANAVAELSKSPLTVQKHPHKSSHVKNNPSKYEAIWIGKENLSNQKRDTLPVCGVEVCNEKCDKPDNHYEKASLQKLNPSTYSNPLIGQDTEINSPILKSHSAANLDEMQNDDSSYLISELGFSDTKSKKQMMNKVKESNLDLLNQTLPQNTNLTANRESDIKIQSVNSKNTQTDALNCKCNNEEYLTRTVALDSKLHKSDNCDNEEEIVFHFPPPPRVPPPLVESTTESFDVVCKNGTLMVTETKNESPEENGESTLLNINENSNCHYPQPAPRKRQHIGLQKSASCIFLSKSETGYLEPKNISHEKLYAIRDMQNIERTVECRKRTALPHYVNIEPQSTIKTTIEDNLKKNLTRGYCDTSKGNFSKSLEITYDICEKKPCISSNSKEYLKQDTSEEHIYGKINKIRCSVDRNRNDKLNHLRTYINKQKVSSKSEHVSLPTDYLENKVELKARKDQSSQKNEEKSKYLNSFHFSLPIRCFPLEKIDAKSHLKPSLRAPDLHKLPAVHENLPDNQEAVLVANRTSIRHFAKETKTHGLKHSKSDASLFQKIRDERLRSSFKESRNVHPKQPVSQNIKHDKEENKSDVTSVEQSLMQFSEEINSDMPLHLFMKSNKANAPVAPPRSKRRSTTELYYPKENSGPDLQNSSICFVEFEDRVFVKEDKLPRKEIPPAIPVKSKEILEIPHHVDKKGKYSTIA